MDFREMGFLIVLFVSFSCVTYGPKTARATNYDVTSYGAIGDGNTDDSKAFLRAWTDVCGDGSPVPTLVIPSEKTFLISPLAFQGPCQSSSVNVKLLGNITAPKTLDGWKDCINGRFWIYFTTVQGLTMEGPGEIDGQGAVWWGKQELTETCIRPTALHFSKCNGLRLHHTTHINSPMHHISVYGCQDADLGYLQIIAPGDSPNTDGVDISSSSHVIIHDSNIQTGDDCVAINSGMVDINITGVFCGPGHGISIGSLGQNHPNETVEQVRVENCTISGTTNGLRIKTVPKGTGYAKGIVYHEINVENVQNPILIDQHYCPNLQSYCPTHPGEPAVEISDVTYTNIYGSSASQTAITFNCSDTYKCTGIKTNQVNITGDGVVTHCENGQGTFVNTSPPISC